MRDATYDFHAAFDLNKAIAQTFIQRALILSFQRKHEQMIIEFEQAQAIKPMEDYTLYVLVAKARMKCQDNEGAILDLQKAIGLKPKEAQLYLHMGRCYENLKRYPDGNSY